MKKLKNEEIGKLGLYEFQGYIGSMTSPTFGGWKGTDRLIELLSIEDMENKIHHFSTHCKTKLNDWQNQLKHIKHEKLRAAVWGSGSKCVSFLTTLNVKEEIDMVVDINPFRHGKFLPGVGKKIMSPESLKTLQPDFTIIMNPTYQSASTLAGGMKVEPASGKILLKRWAESAKTGHASG